jgi:lipoyl(octanoyl) transferase
MALQQLRRWRAISNTVLPLLGYTIPLMTLPICAVHLLGMVEYQAAWDLQNKLAGEIAAGRRLPSLLLLQHPHTFTFGRRGHLENLLWDQAELARRGISLHWVDRGGDVTYHGPGQLVGYPLLPLGTSGLQVEAGRDSAHLPQADYVGYLRKLEQVLILALARLGVAGRQVPGLTGVWVVDNNRRLLDAYPSTPSESEPASPGLAKIAAIGVKVDVRGITRHGFALNVDPDMDYWEGIIGCGLVGHPVARLADLLHPPPSMQAVVDAVIAAFGFVYQYEMVCLDL